MDEDHFLMGCCSSLPALNAQDVEANSSFTGSGAFALQMLMEARPLDEWRARSS